METLQEFKHFSFSTQLAVASFGIGTLLFTLYFILPENEGILLLGLCYVIFASFFNGLVVLNLLYQLLTTPSEREILIIKILIVVANIPIAVVYAYLIINSEVSNPPF